MTMHTVLVHARDAIAIAAKLARRLAKLGLNVDTVSIDQLHAAAPAADRVIVLWSRGAAAAEARLRHHDIASKLCIGRLASGPPPPALRAPIIAVTGSRNNAEMWRALINGETKQMKQGRLEFTLPGYRSTRWEAFLAALLMSIVAGGASYVASPDFAHRIDAAVASFGR